MYFQVVDILVKMYNLVVDTLVKMDKIEKNIEIWRQTVKFMIKLVNDAVCKLLMRRLQFRYVSHNDSKSVFSYLLNFSAIWAWVYLKDMHSLKRV